MPRQRGQGWRGRTLGRAAGRVLERNALTGIPKTGESSGFLLRIVDLRDLLSTVRCWEDPGDVRWVQRGGERLRCGRR